MALEKKLFLSSGRIMGLKCPKMTNFRQLPYKSNLDSPENLVDDDSFFCSRKNKKHFCWNPI